MNTFWSSFPRHGFLYVARLVVLMCFASIIKANPFRSGRAYFQFRRKTGELSLSILWKFTYFSSEFKKMLSDQKMYLTLPNKLIKQQREKFNGVRNANLNEKLRNSKEIKQDKCFLNYHLFFFEYTQKYSIFKMNRGS